ncbi:AAA family ATPase [Streptomyces sp. NBC_01795]|uniref:UvrD-helicase domain-containing protein n=1 Tax=Streptomyces sp. NBC_01795 TaxID=2975943 RepID=UPI002DD7F883|nr:UvrD-helicase domain-containing protein [Streptomyces sp. NBC_01795]WSA95203.1 AAA family ATPase [Streptomyces sp. NBC_01795]
MAEERCVHEMVVGQCTVCAPAPKGLSAWVYITRGGSVFHRTTGCEALYDGQRKAVRSGRDTHAPQHIPLADVQEKRGPCVICFPAHRPSAIPGTGTNPGTGTRINPGTGHSTGHSTRTGTNVRTRSGTSASPKAAGPELPEPKGHQRDVVFLKTEGHCVVLGTAGSGKTTMAVHRAHFLAGAPGIGGPTLLVTFNRALVNHLRAVAGGTPGLRIETYHEFARGYLNGRRPTPVSICGDKAALVERALAAVRPVHPTQPVARRPTRFFLDELRWIAGHGIDERAAYVDGRTRRFGRGSGLRSAEREVVFDVYEAYLELRRARGSHHDWDDLASAVAEELAADRSQRHYRHIVVDEGQDFTPEMLRSLAAAVPADGSFTFFGDYAQQIYGRRMSWRSVGLEVSGVVKFVNNYRNTRQIAALTRAVAGMPHFRGETAPGRSAEPGQDETGPGQDDEADLVQPVRPAVNGPAPTLLQAASRAEQLRMAVRVAIARVAEYKRVGVLMRTREHERELERLFGAARVTARRLDRHLEGWVEGPGLCYGTYSAAKGLEFDSVILPRCDADRLPHPEEVAAHGPVEARAREARQLYVALTRARTDLFLLHSGPLTDLLPDEMSDLFHRVVT